MGTFCLSNQTLVYLPGPPNASNNKSDSWYRISVNGVPFYSQWPPIRLFVENAAVFEILEWKAIRVRLGPSVAVLTPANFRRWERDAGFFIYLPPSTPSEGKSKFVPMSRCGVENNHLGFVTRYLPSYCNHCIVHERLCLKF